MPTIEIYVNKDKRTVRDTSLCAMNAVRSLGVLFYSSSHVPSSHRHDFYRQREGGMLAGIVKVPNGTTLTVVKARKVLSVPLDDGTRINLSAADVLEQARVKGCGLRIAEENS